MSVKLLNLESNIGDIGDKFPLAKRNLKASKLHPIVFSSAETRQLTLSYHPICSLLVTLVFDRFFTRLYTEYATLFFSLLSILACSFSLSLR